jgi:N-acetyl-gamma-glutamyl-phosphate reductase
MNQKFRVAIVGSTGYGGVELVRLLQAHPKAKITSLISSSRAGQKFSDEYPHLIRIHEEMLDDVTPTEVAKKADLVFLATPNGVAKNLAPQFLAAGLQVIDLSGDHRISDPVSYEAWYQRVAPAQQWVDHAVYGLSEVYADKIGAADTDFISNPGCFATSALLGLIPAVKSGLVNKDRLIIDSASGVSGAGRGANMGTHFSELNENFKAYKVNSHQHTPEIEQYLTDASGSETPIVVTFTPHLVPMTRGIMSTMYADLAGDYTDADFVRAYRTYYHDRPFVRIHDVGQWATTKQVTGSNYCDIGFNVDKRTGRVTIITVIDNLVKGAAGQAIQNMNLMQGWPEDLGLTFVPMYP